MATTAPSTKPVTLTVPAVYLEDFQSAAIAEVANDSDGLRAAAPQDRGMSECILRRSTQLLKPLLEATGDVELQAEHDQMSSPLVHALEQFVRTLSERLGAVGNYGPLPMGDVFDIAAGLQWAAEQTVRIAPASAWRLTPSDRERMA